MKNLKRRVEGLETTEARRRQAGGAGMDRIDNAALDRDRALYESNPEFRAAIDRAHRLRIEAMQRDEGRWTWQWEEALYRDNPEFRAAVDLADRLRAAATAAADTAKQ